MPSIVSNPHAPFSIMQRARHGISSRTSPAPRCTVRGRVEEGLARFTLDLRDDTLRWSSATFCLFGLEIGSPIDRHTALEMFDPASRKLLEEVYTRAIQACSAFSLEARITPRNGADRWIRITAGVEGQDGQALRVTGTKQDVTEEHAYIALLEQLAYTDAVTGLANRQRFQNEFFETDALSPTHRPEALVLFDLDEFKVLNDRWGHLAGDACLATFARRLLRHFPQARMIARIGGDEFAMLLPLSSPSPKEAEALRIRLESLRPRLSAPFDWHGSPLPIAVSFGLARTNSAPFALPPRQLFALADADLYRAKTHSARTPR